MALALASTLRATPARGRTTGMVLAYHATPLRSAPRLLGVALTGLLALHGTMRAGPARLRGSITPPACASTLRVAPRLTGRLGLVSTPCPLAGSLVTSPARLPTGGMVLAYRSAPLRAVARLRGTLATPSTGVLQSTLRLAAPRLRPAELTLLVPAAECRGAPARLRGLLTFTVPLRGTLRYQFPRLLGRLDRVTLRSWSPQPPARLIGQVVQQLPLRSTLRAAPARLPGAGTLVRLAGILRTTQRLHAPLGQRQQLAGRLRASARLTGTATARVIVPVDLTTAWLRHQARLRGTLGFTTAAGLVVTLRSSWAEEVALGSHALYEVTLGTGDTG